MKVGLTEIMNWDDKFRLKFINSISGYKGVHLIGTKSKSGESNLAIFNSIVHIGSSPPLIGFIMRPLTVQRDTYDNIMKTGCYTINHVQESFFKQAHYTSAKLPSNTSEFEATNLSQEYISDFFAPYVKESSIKMAVKFKEEKKIEANGTRLIIGEICEIITNEEYVEEDGQIDLEKAKDICVTGLNQYSTPRKNNNLPYARINNIPDFKEQERPDNVVFDESTESYNASLLPYGTNIGAPSIEPTGVSTWINTSVSSFNHSFHNKIELIKKEYQDLIDEYEVNDTLYKSSMSFEPIIGKEYHLYFSEKKGTNFLSLIHPSNWKMKYLGSFILNNDKTWKKIND